MRPKIRGLLIEGGVVREYLAKRKREGLRLLDADWNEDKGSCFPCLWGVLAKAPGTDGLKEERDIWKLAGIDTKERFRMLDGTERKVCTRCRRDIHENAVPCPYCTDFSAWCKTRHM